VKASSWRNDRQPLVVNGNLAAIDWTCSAALHDSGASPHHLGLTEDGQPRHPLRLRGDTRPMTEEST
jgi:hypothetical protein